MERTESIHWICLHSDHDYGQEHRHKEITTFFIHMALLWITDNNIHCHLTFENTQYVICENVKPSQSEYLHNHTAVNHWNEKEKQWTTPIPLFWNKVKHNYLPVVYHLLNNMWHSRSTSTFAQILLCNTSITVNCTWPECILTYTLYAP